MKKESSKIKEIEISFNPKEEEDPELDLQRRRF